MLHDNFIKTTKQESPEFIALLNILSSLNSHTEEGKKDGTLTSVSLAAKKKSEGLSVCTYASSMSHSAFSGSSLKHDESIPQHTTDINNTYGLLIIIIKKTV